MNEHWTLIEKFGSFYKLENGILLYAYRNVDGTMDESSIGQVEEASFNNDIEQTKFLTSVGDSLGVELPTQVLL